MKKLHRRRSGAVHPSPPPPMSDHDHFQLLSFLPAAILALSASLSPQDLEVLAYLISNNNTNSSGKIKHNNHNHSSNKNKISPTPSSSCQQHHQPQFNCDCFGCYTSYWVRWDSSPNRQLIHDIIDAFEDTLLAANPTRNKNQRNHNKSVRIGSRGNSSSNGKKGGAGSSSAAGNEMKRSKSVAKNELGQSGEANRSSSGGGGEEVIGGGGGGDEEGDVERGSVRRFVSFVGEKIWGVWN